LVNEEVEVAGAEMAVVEVGVEPTPRAPIDFAMEVVAGILCPGGATVKLNL
jgi:hypothetical protein